MSILVIIRYEALRDYKVFLYLLKLVVIPVYELKLVPFPVFAFKFSSFPEYHCFLQFHFLRFVQFGAILFIFSI